MAKTYITLDGHEMMIELVLGPNSRLDIECPTLNIDETIYLGYWDE